MSHVIAFHHANIGWKVLCPAFSSTENKSIGKVHGRHQAPELWLFELEVCSVHMNVPIFSSPFLVLQDIRNIYISLKCRHLIANILKQLYSCLSCRNHPIVCMFILIDQIIGGSQINWLAHHYAFLTTFYMGAQIEAWIEGRIEGLLHSRKSLICFQKIKEALLAGILLWISSHVSTE